MREKRSSKKPAPRTRSELVGDAWRQLGRPAVGARVIGVIQKELRDRFGEIAADSPAAIARLLADEGAELRHPEVIEFDAQWRVSRIEKDADQLRDLHGLVVGGPLTLERAETLIQEMEQLRKEFTQSADKNSAQRLRTTAIDARKMAQALSSRETLGEFQRAEQIEIAEWLGVWIKTPNLFADWLELRRRSKEFQKKFSGRDMTP